MLFVFYCFVLTILASLIPAEGQGSCRKLQFTSFPKPGYRMDNHTVRTVEVFDEDICMLECYLEPNCVSYNFHELKKESNTHTCDLNNATVEHDEKLVESKNYTYRGAENACLKNPCKNNATCQAGFTDRDYRCLCVPRSGFKGHNCDEDIDECGTEEHGCEGNTKCNNTYGSYTCRCKHGYRGNGINRTDIDECAEGIHQCDVNAECNNTLESYKCTCNDGFHGNGTNRTDMDEGASGTHIWDVNAESNNTLGSYNCTCKYGFDGNGTNCNVKVWPIIICENNSSRIRCENERKIDIVYANYGRLDRDTCVHPEMTNTNCSAENSLPIVQTKCNGKVSCELVATNSVFEEPCVGTFKYLEVKYKCVLNTDECTDGNHDGDVNAKCNNTLGSYTCTCKDGFHGNGTKCSETDECIDGTHDCGVNAECKDTLGSHNCTCKDGFHGNETRCTDLDEHASGTHGCDVNAESNNTLGSYNCTCKDGFKGNGTNCTEKVWSIIICEREPNRVISCENERKIDVVHANFGRLDQVTCFRPAMSNRNCRAVNSLSTVHTKCNGKVSCELDATTLEFGDPCKGTFECLKVKYKCALSNLKK